MACTVRVCPQLLSAEEIIPNALPNRSTFRRISQDTGKFVRFANGLMNESNSLVAAVMEKLPEVRAVQLQMRDPAQWGAMTETQRNEVSERWVMDRVELADYVARWLLVG